MSLPADYSVDVDGSGTREDERSESDEMEQSSSSSSIVAEEGEDGDDDIRGEEDEEEEEVGSSVLADVTNNELLECSPRREGPSSSSSSSLSSRRSARESQFLGGSQVECDRLQRIRSMRKRLLEDLVREQADELVSVAPDERPMLRFRHLLRQTEIYARSGPLHHLKRSGHADDGDEDAEMLMEEETETLAPTFFTQTPSYIQGTKLEDHQIYGLNWLISLFQRGINGILADEMGLGKTIQTISLLGYLKHFRDVGGPHLIIAAKSIVPNWMREIEKWCPSLRALKFHGPREERERMREEELIPGKYDIIVTSYEVVNKERAALRKFHWNFLIIDEAHKIKNENSILAQNVRLYKAGFRLLLTGTPLQNNLHELWALLNFLFPEVFTDAEEFDSWFKLAEGEAELSVIEQLHKILKPFMLRRMKRDIGTKIPPKREVLIECPLSAMQRKWYKSILIRDFEALQSSSSGDKMRLLNIIMQLRKCCNHPYLFEGAEPGPPFVTDEQLVENSGKMQVLDKLLAKLHREGHRVLIFSQMTRVLDILEDYCLFREFEYCRIDGQTTSEDREQFMSDFNEQGSSKFVFLLSTRAGGLGINLATADTVILFDSDWNPQVDLQAQDRAHRIGQTREVTIIRLTTKATIEEKVLERAMKKLYLDAAVIQQGRLAEKNQTMSREEMMSMVTWGAEKILTASEDRTLTDEDIDALLARGEERSNQINERLRDNCTNNLLDFSLFEDKSMYTFEGMDFSGQPTEYLKVSGLQPDVTEADIRTYFDKNGSLMKVQLSIHVPRSASDSDVDLITMRASLIFESVDGAVLAKNANENGQCPLGHDVSVNFAKKRDSSQVLKDLVLQEITQREPSKRERRVNYSIDAYYREALRVSDGKSKKPAIVRVPRVPTMHEYAFFPIELKDLIERERDYIIARNAAEKKMSELGASREAAYANVPDNISDDERELRDRLLRQAFTNWSRKDFQTFIRLCEQYGRNDIESIAAGLADSHSFQEVTEYADTFWSRYKELSEYEKIIEKIERGESKIVRRKEVAALLRWKTRQYENPWTDLQIDYPSKAKMYNESEDRWLVCMMALQGYGEWSRIREQVKTAWEFRFDWFIKSRTEVELQRRADTLIRIIEKEYEKSSKKRLLDESEYSQIYILRNPIGFVRTVPEKKASKSKKQGDGENEDEEEDEDQIEDDTEDEEGEEEEEIEEDEENKNDRESDAETSQLNDRRRQKRLISDSLDERNRSMDSMDLDEMEEQQNDDSTGRRRSSKSNGKHALDEADVSEMSDSGETIAQKRRKRK